VQIAHSTRYVSAGLMLAGCILLLPLRTTGAQVARPEDVVTITPALSKTGYNPGETFQAALILDIMDGYHLNAHTLTDPYLRPTSIQVPDDSPVDWPFIRYPEDLEKAGVPVTGLVGEQYHERIVIRLVGRIPEDAEVGELKTTLNVEYQTCTETFCLFPVTKPAELKIPVVEPGTEVKEINPEIFAKPGGSGDPPPPPLLDRPASQGALPG